MGQINVPRLHLLFLSQPVLFRLADRRLANLWMECLLTVGAFIHSTRYAGGIREWTVDSRSNVSRRRIIASQHAFLSAETPGKRASVPNIFRAWNKASLFPVDRLSPLRSLDSRRQIWTNEFIKLFHLIKRAWTYFATSNFKWPKLFLSQFSFKNSFFRMYLYH